MKRSTKQRISCVECGAPMSVRVGPHKYLEGINVVLQGIETRECTECGEREVVIPRIEELHRVIARAIAKRPGNLKPREIRFLRSWLGYSSADFARVLGVTPETVSRWESERQTQQMAKPAERLLRVLARVAEPNRDYDLEALLLSDTEKPSSSPLRFAQAKEGWMLNLAS